MRLHSASSCRRYVAYCCCASVCAVRFISVVMSFCIAIVAPSFVSLLRHCSQCVFRMDLIASIPAASASSSNSSSRFVTSAVIVKGLPYPRSSNSLAAAMRTRASVSDSAADKTSMHLSPYSRAFAPKPFGRPPGLPDWPGLKGVSPRVFELLSIVFFYACHVIPVTTRIRVSHYSIFPPIEIDHKSHKRAFMLHPPAWPGSLQGCGSACVPPSQPVAGCNAFQSAHQ